MANTPQTWNMLKAWQKTIQDEVLVPPPPFVGGVSPFSVLSAADAALYGATGNPGDVAIFIGSPKDATTNYPYQCWITPTTESVRWRTNPNVFDEIQVYCLVLGLITSGSQYAVWQNMINIRDAFHVVLMRHSEQPNAPQVQAAKEMSTGARDNPSGFFDDMMLGRAWFTWGATRWIRQQWQVQGNIQS